MSKRKVGTVAFRVEGLFVLNLCREEAVYGSWKKAINMLIDSFQGMTNDHAIALLRGDKTLTGWDSDIEMVDETPENKKQLTDDYIFQYEDTLLIQGQYYKPKYWMEPNQSCNHYLNDTFGGGTFSHERKEIYTGVETASFWLSDAVNYYYTDHIQKISGTRYVVAWEKVSKIPPLWFKDETDANKIIDRRIIGGTFDRIMELDDGCVQPHFQSYVADYGINRPVMPSAIPNQEELLEKLKSQADKDAMDAVERAFEISRLRHEIIQQNGDTKDDYVILCEMYKVPRKPLENWALQRTKAQHLAAKWETVSDSGWKMYADDPNHTDWVIGAGIDPADIYDGKKDVNDAASEWAYEFQKKMTKGNIAVLVPMRKSKLEAQVQHPLQDDKVTEDIVVIPDCTTKWIKVAKQVGKRGGIIIAKTGGQMSHLVMNGEEYGVTVLMHPKADTLFKRGCYVEIDPDNQKYQFPQKSVQEMMTDAALR
ncbi:PEP-utilizing enzyme [Vibrio phage 1.232.O._10N.261.51.E11]|nr:PEP-utilizing enzyme [Vibrio phage 1.232.O._10N.261.51.E11]